MSALACNDAEDRGGDTRSQRLLESDAKRWNIDLSWRAVVEVDNDHCRTSPRKVDKSAIGSFTCGLEECQ